MLLSTIEKNQVIQSFNRSAKTYSNASIMQREVGNRLLDRLNFIHLNPKHILDLGCADGYFTHLLAEKYPDSRLVACDIAYKMLEKIPTPSKTIHRLCGDADQWPLKENHFDLIFANLMIHWSEDLPRLLQQIQRALTVKGLFLFTTMGPDTLWELKQSWQKIDDYTHVHKFMEMHNLGDCLLASEFADPVMDKERLMIDYPQVTSLLNDLRQSGVRNMSKKRRLGLTGKQALHYLQKHYQTFATKEGIPATYEIIYGHAWKTAVKKPRIRSNHFAIPVEQITIQRSH